MNKIGMQSMGMGCTPNSILIVMKILESRQKRYKGIVSTPPLMTFHFMDLPFYLILPFPLTKHINNFALD